MSDERVDIEAAITRFLGRRDHSTGELRQKLSKRGFDSEVVDEVLSDLTDAGWLDDEAFAAHQATLLADQCWGPLQIRAKLRKHGIGRGLAATTVDGLDADWTVNARRRLDSRYGTIDESNREKAFRHLQHRGFPAAVARRAIFD